VSKQSASSGSLWRSSASSSSTSNVSCASTNASNVRFCAHPVSRSVAPRSSSTASRLPRHCMEPRMNANERGYRRSLASAVPASQPPDQTMDLQPRPAEVQQQAQTQVAGFEVVHALRAMHVVYRANRLRFDSHHLRDQQVGNILPDNDRDTAPSRRPADRPSARRDATHTPARVRRPFPETLTRAYSKRSAHSRWYAGRYGSAPAHLRSFAFICGSIF
jgi:hypothetical protein